MATVGKRVENVSWRIAIIRNWKHTNECTFMKNIHKNKKKIRNRLGTLGMLSTLGRLGYVNFYFSAILHLLFKRCF